MVVYIDINIKFENINNPYNSKTEVETVILQKSYKQPYFIQFPVLGREGVTEKFGI